MGFELAHPITRNFLLKIRAIPPRAPLRPCDAPYLASHPKMKKIHLFLPEAVSRRAAHLAPFEPLPGSGRLVGGQFWLSGALQLPLLHELGEVAAGGGVGDPEQLFDVVVLDGHG